MPEDYCDFDKTHSNGHHIDLKSCYWEILSWSPTYVQFKREESPDGKDWSCFAHCGLTFTSLNADLLKKGAEAHISYLLHPITDDVLGPQDTRQTDWVTMHVRSPLALTIVRTCTSEKANLDRAIEVSQEAVDLTTSGHIYRRTSLNNLGHGLSTMYCSKP